MSKIIGIILLVTAVFLISMVWKTAPVNNPLSSKPSETAVPQTNTQTNYGQYSAPAAGQGGAGTVISQPPQSQATPLNQRVYISSANVSGYPLKYSHITLYSRLKEEETVDITGWKLKSNKSEIAISKAVEIYNPSGFGAEGDIVLKPNNYVDLYGLTSPLNKNLRLNKCFGYLQNIYNFQPIYLPNNCPYVSRDDIKQLSGQCQNYIYSLGSCQLPDTYFYNSLPGTAEGNDCRAFLNNIGYGNCFRGHYQDQDFLSDNWIIWLGQQNLNLDPQHDYARLYDKEGNLVSEYNY